MALHDAYARRTPWELAFPEDAAADTLVREIAEEASAREVDTTDRAAFGMLSSAGAFVHELQGPDAPAEAIHDYLALVFHAFHFVRAGKPLYFVDTPTARHLVERPGAAAGPVAPAPAGYVQLPRHLFWVDGGGEGAAEPVDGVFWTLAGDTIHVLLATGVRDDRPGLAVVALPGVPFADAGSWIDADVRPGGGDFATTLPGGELETLYSVTAAGEVLKLLARLFAYAAAAPDALEERTPEAAPPAGPAPSRLPYTKVAWHG